MSCKKKIRRETFSFYFKYSSVIHRKKKKNLSVTFLVLLALLRAGFKLACPSEV